MTPPLGLKLSQHLRSNPVVQGDGENDLGGAPAGEGGQRDIVGFVNWKVCRDNNKEYDDNNIYFAERIICIICFMMFSSPPRSVQLLMQEQLNLLKGHHSLGIIPEIQRIGVDHIFAYMQADVHPGFSGGIGKSQRVLQ